MKKKKLMAVVVCTGIMLNLVLHVFASSGANEETDNENVKIVSLSDGYAKLENTDDYVLLVVDALSENEAEARSQFSLEDADENRELENRVLTATMYIPGSEEEQEDIYNELSDALDAAVLSAQTGSSTINGGDSCNCADFTLTVNYTRETIDGETYYAMTSISGGFSDSSTTGDYVGENVYVTSHSVCYGQIGDKISGGFTNTQNIHDYAFPTTKRSWALGAPISWEAVSSLGEVATVGATYKFTLSRGAASWTSQLQLNIVDNYICLSD